MEEYLALLNPGSICCYETSIASTDY